MNYIKELQKRDLEQAEVLASVRDGITEIMAYLSSPKFQGTDNDYVHVTTDIMPKLSKLRMLAGER